MSRYSGPQQAGAARLAREVRRVEALDRATRTPIERTAFFRRQRARIREALGRVEDRAGAV